LAVIGAAVLINSPEDFSEMTQNRSNCLVGYCLASRYWPKLSAVQTFANVFYPKLWSDHKAQVEFYFHESILKH